MKEKTVKQVSTLLVVFALIIAFFFPFLSTLSPAITSAEEITYTNVLEDLQKDTNFKREDYPVVADDYSIEVIQIAESENKELFIYTYQPTGQVEQLQATSISLSFSASENEEKTYHNYDLQFLSSNGVFFKYLVKGFVTPENDIRYYEIPTIRRNFIDYADEDIDNTIDEKAFPVAKLWKVITINGETHYECRKTEVIEITDMFVSFLRYKNGFFIFDGSCDSHYIAFSTDRLMEELFEADVEYTWRKADYKEGYLDGNGYSYGDPQTKFKELKRTDEAGNTPGWFGTQHNWNRIQRVDKFLEAEKEELTEEERSKVSGKQWVLRFTETEYHEWDMGRWKDYSEVTEVSILRLKFRTAGTTYNLGVVSNKQSGDLVPGNKQKSLWDMLKEYLEDFFKSVLGAVLTIVLLIIIVCKLFDFIIGLFTGGRK